MRVNYRTSHQIREQADRLLGPEVSDVDGNVEDRRGTISVFNGPVPLIATFDTAEEESEAVARWIHDRLEKGTEPKEIAVFVRSEAELPRAKAATERAGVSSLTRDGNQEPKHGQLSITTMHLEETPAADQGR